MQKMVDISYNNASFSAYHTAPDDDAQHPALIVVHEVWGLVDHIKDVANRFAKEGYTVLAPDLLSHTGVTEKLDAQLQADLRNPDTRSEAQKKFRAILTPIFSPEFGRETVGKLKECVTYLLKDPYTTDKIGIVGFCFGGSFSYALSTQDNRLSAAVPFYGHAPQPVGSIANISCPILAFYGEKDTDLVSGLPELESIMQQYEKDFTYKVYPNTGHAFFNDTNHVTYNKDAAEDSWASTLAFLETNLL